jgi:hypothetical protein
MKRELAPTLVPDEVVNAVDVLKPAFCHDQFDDLLHPDNPLTGSDDRRRVASKVVTSARRPR